MKVYYQLKRFFLFTILMGFLFSNLFLIPSHAQVTKPEDYFGYKPGADFHLINYEQAIGYFEQITGQTDRMQIFDMGITTGGRKMKYGVISSAENMAQLDHYKDINKRISIDKMLTEEEAKRLAGEGKAIVWIDGGLHGTEVAPAQLLPQLAYDLVAGEDQRTKLIRENVITLLVFANPDGMTIVADWYMGNVGTPYEVSQLPWLYHEYVGHDNNRDSFMSNLVETQNMNKATSQEWFPEVLYNQHQTGPFPARIWIPPDAEPTNPNVHPLIVRWKNLIGSAMGKAFDEANQPGAISRIRYDTWYPGYTTQVVDGHNTVSILTETQLYRYATPQFFTVNDFPKEHRDLLKGAFYPSPWLGGWWRLGDAVAYNETASLAVLETVAKYKYEFLHNKYVIRNDVIEQFKKQPPYGWIVPKEQRAPNAAALMLDRLIINGIEVYKMDESFTYAGNTFAAGGYMIPTSQPYGFFVKNILEKQSYPDLRDYPHLWQGLVGTAESGEKPLRAYDGAGWTLPLQMGVECIEMSRPVDGKMTAIDKADVPGGLTGGGSKYIFSNTDNRSYAAAFKILAEGGKVEMALDDFSLNGREYTKGSFIASNIGTNQLRQIAKESQVDMRGGNVLVSTRQLSKPRIGLYKSWVANTDAGWIRYIFDRFGFQYHMLTDAEMRAGNLNKRFDVIILPDQRASSIIEGHRKGTIPPDYVGGIGDEGVQSIKTFVEDGGTLVCNNNSSILPIEEFKLPIRDVLEDVESDSFSCPGSILRLNYDISHPVAYGMEERGIAFFSRGHVFELVPDTTKSNEDNSENIEIAKPQIASPKIVAVYPDESLLLSGWIIGEEVIQNKAAVMDVAYGDGKIILFGFNVENRAQAHATFKLLFNTLYY